jgi:endonuclease/exonuclease/phosphatase (EEP) superfamily protein YafD
VDQTSYLAQRLGMESAYGPNGQLGAGYIGNATLSTYPIVGQANTHLPNEASTREDQQRGVLKATIQVGESIISVYNTHLQHMQQYDYLRRRQMEAIAGSLRAESAPVILGGDLNSGPTSGTLAVARTVLKDAWDTVGVGSGKTAPAANPRGRIDYLLYSDPLVPQSSQVLFSQVSDHRAVLTTFQLPAQASPICVPVFDEPLS